MRVKYDKNMVRGYQVVAKRHFLPFLGFFLRFLSMTFCQFEKLFMLLI